MTKLLDLAIAEAPQIASSGSGRGGGDAALVYRDEEPARFGSTTKP